jgi:8-amino-7-oxononanoate synthase
MFEPEPLQQLNRTYVRVRGRTLSYFAGCDYFRMASHPAVLRALCTATAKYGLNVAASRMTTGNHDLYRKLESALAGYFGAESALVVSTGYLANLVVAQALARTFSHVLVDARSHPSIRDAAALFECPILQFKHRDPEDARHAAERCGPGARLVLLTDGMFSHDGSVAPLKRYLELLPKDTLLLVDDAHGAGILGLKGKGAPEHEGVARGRVVQTITLSKAFGVYGGVVLGPAALRHRTMKQSRIFSGSTPLPLPLVSAALEAVAVFKRAKGGLRLRLTRNADFVKKSLRAAGYAMPEYPGPIISLAANNARAAVRLKRNLLDAGIYPSFIKYHDGPKDGYFRFVISSEHTAKQVQALVQALTSNSSRKLVK